ncbi:hypothetical protein S7711_05809 [Stachybotrys chartarum IBT 7711]|uniref:Alpha-mannosidase n=1 Tax=Stachybotrys chartarum (strain CBS 109288 / IBT 7711) TaxID=1280523 RepID=A0A084AM47_STACB|nr:hypothetical protein S7711_05809 [Stachybotrys chartarum IBT 7711]
MAFSPPPLPNHLPAIGLTGDSPNQTDLTLDDPVQPPYQARPDDYITSDVPQQPMVNSRRPRHREPASQHTSSPLQQPESLAIDPNDGGVQQYDTIIESSIITCSFCNSAWKENLLLFSCPELFSVIHDAATELPEDTWEQHEALNVASRIIDTFRVGDDASIRACHDIAAEYLGDKIDSAEVYQSPLDRRPTIYAVASYSRDIYFKWLKEIYPYGWERVKAKVKSGQFQPIVGSWVEHDTNLPCGESLVRQFLYGQRFFEAEFGFRSTTSWLPDTFDFSCQMPQICRLAGMTSFLTQKPCFNSVNDFPHTTFNCISNHKSLDQDNTALLAFGKGDGGGGPTWQHLERLRRLRGMADTMGVVPRVHTGASADHFFERLQKKGSSLAKTKAHNRKSEILLHDLEFLATIASIENQDFVYPKKELDEMWHGVMLCQFHDCLPGTAIEMCYQDSDTIKRFMKESIAQPGRFSKPRTKRSASDTLETSSVETAVGLNTLSWPRKEWVTLPNNEVALANGEGLLLTLEPFQTTAKHPRRVTVQEASPGILENDHLRVRVEEGSITSIYDRRARREALSGKANHYTMFDDKPVYWQAWDVEVYHLETRQELTNSTCTIVEDTNHRVSIVTETAISELSSIKTTISLSAVVDDDQPSLIECTADVEWHETMKFLKVEFPVLVKNTEASYETQYGIIKRPTHYNTSWDMAKFEVCCHKFADLSEYNYGVSILNDSKYGFSTVGDVMRLSLLRSPKAPDGNADMGHHRIRWAIMPHQGSLSAQTVRAAFNFNNLIRLVGAPAVTKDKAHSSFPISLSGDDNLVLDWVKRGEDDEDVFQDNLPKRKGKSIIVRVYDSLGGRSRGTVSTRYDIAEVWKTNILEDKIEEITSTNGSFDVELGPFEVATYRIQLSTM